jgi:hypothetical protein
MQDCEVLVAWVIVAVETEKCLLGVNALDGEQQNQKR